MEIIWSPGALRDLAEINKHIAEDNPQAAAEMVRRIVSVAEELLSRQPNMGRPGRVPNTRELPVSGTPYLMPYRVVRGHVEIIRVYHGARRWPERF